MGAFTVPLLTGLNKLTVKQLNNHVRPKVSMKWSDLGVELFGDADKVDIIKRDHPNNAEMCCTEMFKVWLQRDNDPSWYKLVNALRAPSVGLHALASDIEKLTASK